MENYKVSLDLMMINWLTCAFTHRIVAVDEPPILKNLASKAQPSEERQVSSLITIASSPAPPALLVTAVMLLTYLPPRPKVHPII